MPLDEQHNLPVSPADWPPIDRTLLGEARPAPAAFPLHLLPGRWRDWVEAAARPFGSADYLASGLLAAVAAVGGAGIRVAVTAHWQEPLLLWQALVGGPSSGKSATFARLSGLLEAVKPWEDSHERAAPRVLVDARLYQVDVGLWGSGRGVVLWRSDLGHWMDEAAGRAERPAWLAGWAAGPAMIRGLAQDCFAVGVMGALSPERLAPGFIDGDSALAARFLYVWPEPPGWASLNEEPADDQAVVALLQKIANLAGHRDTPGRMPLDDATGERLEEIMAELRQRADAADGVEAEWIAKGVSTVVRLGGLLALMQWADAEAAEEGPTVEGPTVELGHLEAAWTLWSGYYLPQAESVFDRGGVVGCERAARRVARWLKRLRGTEISREDVRRQALCQTVTAEGAEDVLARLEAGGVLRPLQASGSAKGGPRRRRWAVHPELAVSQRGSWRS